VYISLTRPRNPLRGAGSRDTTELPLLTQGDGRDRPVHLACGRLAERHCRKAGAPVPIEQLVAMLEAHDVLTDRAQASIRLAVTIGRLEAVTDSEGNTCVRVPTKRAVA